MGSTQAGYTIAATAGKLFKTGKLSADAALRYACKPYLNLGDVDFDGAYYENADFAACLIAAISPNFKDDPDNEDLFFEKIVHPFYMKYLPKSA